MYALARRPAAGVRFVRLGRLGDIVSDLAAAIQRFEGWAPGSVSFRNNNPGNLRAGPGQVGTDSQGYAIFPDYATGWAALQNQVQTNISRGLTLNEFFAGVPGVYPGYAPATDRNNPAQYAATVAGWVGISPDVPLASYQAGAPASAPGPAGSGDLTMTPADIFGAPALSSDVAGLPGWAVAAGVILGGALLVMVLE